MSAPLPTCRSCGASVRWAQTKSGRFITLDPEPNPEGNLVYASRNPDVVHVTSEPWDGSDRYVTHFATCPDAGIWRKRASSSGGR